MKVVKVDSKLFVGRDILHVSLFNSKSKETVYNLIYRDGKNGTSYMKRFKISGVIRDKDYNLTQGKEGSEVLYFSESTETYSEVSVLTLMPIWILALFCIFLGINTGLTVDVANMATEILFK